MRRAWDHFTALLDANVLYLQSGFCLSCYFWSLPPSYEPILSIAREPTSQLKPASRIAIQRFRLPSASDLFSSDTWSQGAALEASLQDRSIWIDPARHERPLSKREGTHNRCRPVGRRRFRTAVPRLEGLIHTSGQSRSRCSNNPGETLRKSSLGEIIAHATR